jgi:signal transduction histidine kinase
MPTPRPVPLPSGPAPASPTYRRLYRNRNDRVVAGVASGLAEHLRVPVLAVRLVLIGLLAVDGFGGLLYVAFWAFLPAGDGPPPRREMRRVQRIAFLALAVGVVVLSGQLRAYSVDSAAVGLAAVAVLGAGLIWRQAAARDGSGPQAPAAAEVAPAPVVQAVPTLARATAVHEQAVRAEAEASPDRRWFIARVIGGGLLMVIGIVGILGFFAPGEQSLSATLIGLLFAVLALAGLVLALVPVLWRMAGQLREERVGRIRQQERAEVAAIVHDQVLHTLALIQRHSGDSGAVARLARGQERSLRSWLYRPAGSPTERFAAALEQVAAEVEDAYGIEVETVVVGDAGHDERVVALVAATREALVNAARHAKVTTVSLYAEVEGETLTVFVRDRGTGFDLSTVGDDRHGVHGSIIGRMQRNGGTARIRSTPGEGTEVELSIRRGS